MTARTTWQCSTCRDAGMQRGICSLRCPIDSVPRACPFGHAGWRWVDTGRYPVVDRPTEVRDAHQRAIV